MTCGGYCEFPVPEKLPRSSGLGSKLAVWGSQAVKSVGNENCREMYVVALHSRYVG